MLLMSSRNEGNLDDGQARVHLSVLSDVARIASASLSLDDALRRIMAAVSHQFAPENWSVLLADDGGGLRFGLAMGQAASGLESLRIEPGEGVAGWVALHDEMAVIADVDEDGRFEKRFDEESGFRTRSLVALPLRSRGRVVGVMELVNVLESKSLTDADLGLLQTLCEAAGVAVDNARTHARVVELARSDALTGLLNSTAFSEEVERVARRSEAAGEPFSVVFMDVDDFKHVVDTHGHLEGSRVLAEVGHRIGRSLQSGGVATRFGGDEFAVLLPGTSRGQARVWAEALRARLRGQPYACGAGTSVGITLSVGLASCPENGHTAAEVLKASDVAMYAVKAEGKDGCGEAGAAGA